MTEKSAVLTYQYCPPLRPLSVATASFLLKHESKFIILMESDNPPEFSQLVSCFFLNITN